MNRTFTLSGLPTLKQMALACLLLTVVTVVQAQKTWVGANNGTWSTASNWSGGTLPTATDNVVLSNSTNVVMNTTATIASITVASASNGTTTLTFNSGSQLTVTGAISVGSNGNRKGSIVMTSGGVLKVGSISINPGNNVGNALFTPGSGTVELTGTNTLPSNVNYNTFNNLIITGATTTSATPIIINGNATINSGGSLIESGNPAITFGGNLTNNGAITAGTGVHTFTGAGKFINGSNVISLPNVVINTPAGALINNDATLTIGSSLSGTGKLKQGGGSRLNIGGAISITALDAASNPINIVTYNGTGPQNVLSTTYGNLALSGNNEKALPTGPLNIIQGILITGGTVTANGNLTVGGNFTLDNSTVFNAGTTGTYTHTVTGDWASSTGTINGAATFVFNNAGFQSIGTGNFRNVVFTGGGNKSATGNINAAGDLTINSGTTFSGTTFAHTVGGNWVNNGTFSQGTGSVTFNGSAPQTLGGTSATTFYDFGINNTSGVTLGKPTSIQHILTFSNGNINSTNANLLIFNDGDGVFNPINGASDNSFVNGPVQKIGNDPFAFPIGKEGAGYHPAGIADFSDPANGGTFTAEYIRSSARALSNNKATGLQAVSFCEYWNISNATTPTISARVRLTWSASSPCDPGGYITDPGSIVVAHYNGTQWDNLGGTVGAGSTGISGSVETPGLVSGFSPFTIGTTNATLNPLPVTFISFEGRKSAGGTQLTWKVAGEQNVSGYDVERKTAGGQFAKIGFVPANGSTSYTFTDGAQHNGAVFYRLKDVDNDGRFTYSTILSFKNGAGSIEFNVFPTVVSGNATVQHAAAGNSAQLTLSTADGKQVKQLKVAPGSIQTSLNLSGLHSGMYLLRYTNGTSPAETMKLIKW